MSSFDMTCLETVTHVSLPSSGLPDVASGAPYTGMLLPPNLESFQIIDCEYGITRFLQAFLERERNAYPFLHEVEILFNGSDMDHLIRSSGPYAESFIRSVEKQMENAGVKVSWMFKGPKTPLNVILNRQSGGGTQTVEDLRWLFECKGEQTT